MAKHPTPLELRYRLWFRVVDLIGSSLQMAIPWAALVLVVYFGKEMVSSLSGRYTFAEIGVSFLGDLRISDAAAYIFGAGGLAYGVKRRKLQGDNIERTAKRIKELEERLDANRSSSRLTERGRTRPEDKHQ